MCRGRTLVTAFLLSSLPNVATSLNGLKGHCLLRGLGSSSWGGTAAHRGAVAFRGLATKRRSVSGEVYAADATAAPVVTLFTKEGCTLCDKVKDVLIGVRDEAPHFLIAADITDKDKREWWDRYKYDIPVLHVNGIYMAKHRLTSEEAVAALAASAEGTFVAPQGEPNAAKCAVLEDPAPSSKKKV